MNTASKRKTIKKLTSLSLFLAIGIILSIVESMIPLPIPVPGVRLGLANTVGLVLLYIYSPKQYLYIGFLRVVMVGLLRTGLFSISFYLSLSGFVLSHLIVLILYYLNKFSIYGLSITAALFHGVGQMITVMFIYSTSGLILYLPILMLSGIISGALTALITSIFLIKVSPYLKIILEENIQKEC